MRVAVLSGGEPRSSDQGGEELEMWGDDIQQVAPDRLALTKISVDGLRAGTQMRVFRLRGRAPRAYYDEY